MVAEIDKRENLDLIQYIYGDPNRYLQILLNFMSNSLKFTNPNGQITVFVKIKSNQLIERIQKNYVELVK